MESATLAGYFKIAGKDRQQELFREAIATVPAEGLSFTELHLYASGISEHLSSQKRDVENYLAECARHSIRPFLHTGFTYRDGLLKAESSLDAPRQLTSAQKDAVFALHTRDGRDASFTISFNEHDKSLNEFREGSLKQILGRGYGIHSGRLEFMFDHALVQLDGFSDFCGLMSDYRLAPDERCSRLVALIDWFDALRIKYK